MSERSKVNTRLWFTRARQNIGPIWSTAAHAVGNGIAALGRFVGRVFLVALFLGVPLSAVVAFFVVQHIQDPPTAMTTIAVAFSLLLAEASALFVYVVGRLILRFLSSSLVFGGAGPATRLVALIVAVVFFRHLPMSIARFVTSGAVGLVFGIPLSVAQNSFSGTAGLRSGGIPEMDHSQVGRFVAALVHRVLLDLANLGSSLSQTLDLAVFLLFVIVWIVLALILHQLHLAGAGVRLRTFVVEHPSLNLPNLGFFVLLIGALFLSLAAITSLPRLRERYNPNSDVSPETLRATLERLQTSKEQMGRYLASEMPPQTTAPSANTPAGTAASAPPTIGTTAIPTTTVPQQPAKPLSTTPQKVSASTVQDPLNVSDRQWLEFLTRRVDDQRRVIESQFDTLRQQRLTLTESILASQAQAKDNAVNQFRIENLDRRGSREEVEHFLLIHSWFVYQVRSQEDGFIDCTRRVREFASESTRWLNQASSQVAMAGGSSSLNTVAAASYAPFSYSFYASADNACSLPQLAPIPVRPPLGESLGVLKYGAAWLLDAGSVPLAAIIGMIGFGLLGSVISRFVRERVASSRGGDRSDAVALVPHVLVSDLAGVVLRGLSAAIVVFLAVQGGLAVFAGGQSDPNPYVLLLTCLVAAVFSEKVWARANDYLMEKLQGGESAKEPAIDQSNTQNHDSETSDEPPTVSGISTIEATRSAIRSGASADAPPTSEHSAGDADPASANRDADSTTNEKKPMP